MAQGGGTSTVRTRVVGPRVWLVMAAVLVMALLVAPVLGGAGSGSEGRGLLGVLGLGVGPAGAQTAAPTADAGGPYRAVIDEPLQLDASGSAAARGGELTFAWDLDGDGVTDDATGPRPTFVGESEGEVAIAVEVTETAHGIAATDRDPSTVYVDVRLQTAEADNVDRAIALSRLAHPDTFGGPHPSTVLLGTDGVFADSLASGGAQGVLGAPLLLTGAAALDQRTADELARLRAEEVILLGGLHALSPAIETGLTEQGYQVTRWAGASRIETAIVIASAALPSATRAVLVRAHASAAGDGDPTQAFADSLAAGALAAELGLPVLLTASDELPEEVAAYLRDSSIAEVLVVGGTEAIAEAVRTGLRELEMTVVEVAGDERAGTAVAVAGRQGFASADEALGALLVDARGQNTWADAFPAALLSAMTDSPLLLTDGETLPQPTAAWLESSGLPVVCTSLVSETACEAADQVSSAD